MVACSKTTQASVTPHPRYVEPPGTITAALSSAPSEDQLELSANLLEAPSEDQLVLSANLLEAPSEDQLVCFPWNHEMKT